MKQVILKINFDDEGCYKGHGDNTAQLIKEGLETYINIDLEDDGVVKKGWSVSEVPIKVLIEKYEIQKNVVRNVIMNTANPNDCLVESAVSRFITQFINDLKIISNQ